MNPNVRPIDLGSDEASSEIERVVDLIVREQARFDRNVPSLGDDRDGLLAELGDLDPPWTETVRLVESNGEIVAAAIADWDTDSGRAWIHGPWSAAADDEWAAVAGDLLEAMISQFPDSITRVTMTGVTQHRLLAELADEVGWSPTEINHVMILDADVAERWPGVAEPRELRSMTVDDVAGVARLHDVEFPATYYSAMQLASRAQSGSQVVLVATGGHSGDIDGYVAGQIQPDGDGYIDFLAVDPSARGGGLGRELLMAVSRELLPRTASQRMCLTVQAERRPAIALYESLGLRRDVSIIGYEGSPGTVR